MTNLVQSYDIVISGGGLAGATAAIGLARLGLTIALVEQVEPEQEISVSFDQRAVALSDASVAIYKSLGIWEQLSSIACPIKHISISDKGHFGFTRLNARDYNVDSLGEVIPLDETGPILWRIIKAESNITTYCPAKVESISIGDNYCEVKIETFVEEELQHSHLRAKLLLAADGTFSEISKQLDIDVYRDSYAQHAVIANIETESCHQFRAFERFTSSGPLALLPLTSIDFDIEKNSSKRMSLVWCQKPEDIGNVMSLNDDDFIVALQKSFGFRLGKIEKIGKRTTYPLGLHLAKDTYSHRVLLLGNSAHTLHPIAGQGFNLGQRDIAALIDKIEQAMLSNHDFGSADFLEEYTLSRQSDWNQTVTATDTFARLFSHQFLPLVLVRNVAMNLVNKVPMIKRQLTFAAMGYSGHSSKLARGLVSNQSKDWSSIDTKNKNKV